MTLSEELDKLAQLHQRGGLTDTEFAQAKSRLIHGDGAQAPAPFVSAVNALRRSRSDRWIAGVCGGIAQTTGMASWAWRLLFAALFFFGGAGLVLYVLMWIMVPAE